MRRAFSKVAAVVAMLAVDGGMMAASNSSYLPQSQNIRVKEAVSNMPTAPRPMQERIISGSSNPYKISKKVYKNQKQYRKMLRSNPHFRNSKKNKLN